MSNHKKMNIADLQPAVQDIIDWNTLDTFFNVDAPRALGSSLVLVNAVNALNVLELPSVDRNIVMSYLQKMTKDTQQMSNALANLRATYEMNKSRFKGKYDENAHMYSITVAFEMQEWLEQYESTIAQSITDVSDYIHSVSPETNLIKP